jgi:hypothetical protein
MFELILAIAFFVLINWCWWRILGKMGYFGWKRWVLLVFTGWPLGSLGLGLIFLALEWWPIHWELRKKERR